MKIISILFLVLLSLTSRGQNNLNQKDSLNILLKAKLMTTSEYGIGINSEQIIEDITKQNAMFLETMYNDFLFVKVEFNQPYRFINGSIVTLTRDCYYFIAFNTINSRFYRIGGFDIIDIDDFIKDLEDQEYGIFKDITSKNEIENIDIYCLYNYYKLSLKKRKDFKCFDNCRDITTTSVGGYNIKSSDKH